MNRRNIILCLAAIMLGNTAVFAANKVYKYRCPKCKLIQEYQISGTKKCPNDGRTMLRIN
jgi:hypothetical protein